MRTKLVTCISLIMLAIGGTMVAGCSQHETAQDKANDAQNAMGNAADSAGQAAKDTGQAMKKGVEGNNNDDNN